MAASLCRRVADGPAICERHRCSERVRPQYQSQMQFTGAVNAGGRPDPPESASVTYGRMACGVARVFGPASDPLLHGALCVLLAPTFLHDAGTGGTRQALAPGPCPGRLLPGHLGARALLLPRSEKAALSARPRLFVPRTQARYIHHVPIRLLAAILVPAINSLSARDRIPSLNL